MSVPFSSQPGNFASMPAFQMYGKIKKKHQKKRTKKTPKQNRMPPAPPPKPK